MITRRGLGMLLASAPLSAWTQSHAERWPTRPVRIMVGYPPGSAPDVILRSFTDALSAELGQPVLVENRAGASGNIAMELVAKAADGHTLAFPINGNLSTAKALNPKLSFDPLKDFSFISLVATTPLVLVAQPNLPAGRDFFAAARGGGDTWNYGSLGIGSISHLWMELMQDAVGLKAVHVPFAGAQQIISAMLGGQVQMALMPPGAAMAQVRAGRLRAIAITGGRSALVPEVPPLSEYGFNVYSLEGWAALVGPASLPRAVVERLSATVGQLLRHDEIRQRMFNQGWRAVSTSPDGLRQRAVDEAARFAPIIKRLGLKFE
jgi:tripartite-type tricarboxylate transporter receptor subunit TctC